MPTGRATPAGISKALDMDTINQAPMPKLTTTRMAVSIFICAATGWGLR